MTDRAVLTDGLFLRRRVALVVAAEAARVVGMAQIVGVNPPLYAQVREDVALVERHQRLPRALNVVGPLRCDIRILLLIDSGEGGR